MPSTSAIDDSGTIYNIIFYIDEASGILPDLATAGRLVRHLES